MYQSEPLSRSSIKYLPSETIYFVNEGELAIGHSGSPFNSTLSGFPVKEDFERKTGDEPGRGWHNFEHYRSHAAFPDSMNRARVACSYVDPSDGGFYHVSEAPGVLVCGGVGLGDNGWDGCLAIPRWHVPRLDGGFVPPPAKLDELKVWALRSILPIVKSELSVINSVIELKDVLTFKDSIRHLRTLPVLISSGLRDLSRKYKRKCLRELLRVGSDAFLQWKFNIGPMISDIRAIYRSVTTSEQRIRKFINRAGSLRTSHFTKALVEYQDQSVQGEYGRTAHFLRDEGGVCDSRTDVASDYLSNTRASEFHVEVLYNYNYTKFQVEHARLLALLDSLGVSADPSIIWNALPWSFVVDWVIGVSRFLENFRVSNMEPEINILRCLWSIRRERTVYATSRVCAVRNAFVSPTYYPPQSIVRGVVTETAYSRHLFTPDVNSLTTSGVNSNEFTLGAALVFARGRHHSVPKPSPKPVKV